MATAKFRQRSSYINHSILFFMALTIILPLLVLIFNSIKPVEEFGTNPLGFPSEIRLMNYQEVVLKTFVKEKLKIIMTHLFDEVSMQEKL